MIVSCPACSARYRIDQSKIKGRGAKITCPRCGHKFIVYKDDAPQPEAAPPAPPPQNKHDISRRDFRKVGVTWRVRETIGVTYSFHQLDALMQYMADGQVDQRDSLSYDARTWVPLDSIDSLPDYFQDIWGKAVRGALTGGQRTIDRVEQSIDETEAPTTIMGHGHALMDDIRKAVAEATTPPPSPSRRSSPTRSPTPHSSSPLQVPPRQGGPRRNAEEAEDPTTFSRRSPVAGSTLTPSSSDIRSVRPTSPPKRSQRQGTASPVPEPPPNSSPADNSMGMDRDQIQLLVTVVLALAAIIAVTVMAFMYAGIIPGMDSAPQPKPTPHTMSPTSIPRVTPMVQPITRPSTPPSVVDPGSETEAKDTDPPPPTKPTNPGGMIPNIGSPAAPGNQ